MKNWFSTLCSSAALDSNADSVRRNNASPDSRALEDVHQALADSRPNVRPPEDLHFSIMRAVREEARRRDGTPARAHFAPQRRLAVSAACVCALLVFAGALLPLFSPGDQPLKNLETVHSAVADATAASANVKLLSPLEDELQRLDTDLRNTAEHLLASVP